MKILINGSLCNGFPPQRQWKFGISSDSPVCVTAVFVPCQLCSAQSFHAVFTTCLRGHDGYLPPFSLKVVNAQSYAKEVKSLLFVTHVASM